MDEEFRELRKLSITIDDGIKRLEKTWENPQLIIGGYGEKFGNPEQYVEQFFHTIKEVQDQLIKDRECQRTHITKTDQYLDDVQKFHQQLKDQCKEVEDMLSEYGYKPLNNSECLPEEESRIEVSGADSSILSLEGMEDLVIRSPVPLHSNDETDFLSMPVIQRKSIATPVITSLASVMRASKQSNMEMNVKNSQKGDYSPYYGRRFKQEL